MSTRVTPDPKLLIEPERGQTESTVEALDRLPPAKGEGDCAASTLRATLFRIGDFVFLVAVGAITTLTMHFMHQLGWNFAITCVTGMLAAMLIQMLMAFCTAPLLGSIETMTPSMVIGMVSPMSICTLHMIGFEPDFTIATVLGAAFGAGMFAFVACYGVRVRRLLERAYPMA